jgi:hypothetical protein
MPGIDSTIHIHDGDTLTVRVRKATLPDNHQSYFFTLELQRKGEFAYSHLTIDTDKVEDLWMIADGINKKFPRPSDVAMTAHLKRINELLQEYDQELTNRLLEEKEEKREDKEAEIEGRNKEITFREREEEKRERRRDKMIGDEHLISDYLKEKGRI